MMTEAYHWQDDALCAQTDPELFVLDRGDSTKPGKKVCAMCIVRDECLEEALLNPDDHSIRGGKTARERRKMRKAQ